MALRHGFTFKNEIFLYHLNFQGIFIIEKVVIFSPVFMTRSCDSLAAILDKKIKAFSGTGIYRS